jgi:predicted GIY-YIG superfamily endonuclease
VRYVYILQSLSDPTRHYVGLTHDLQERLAAHNSGKCHHTAKYVPWKIVVATYFEDDDRAVAFERYLKSGSGRAFAKRHLT